MADSAWFLIGAALLAAGLAAGWLRWWRHGSSRLRSGGLAAAVVTVATVGALVGAPVWWLDLAASFPWDLSPGASRLLAGAALSFAVAGILALERADIRSVDMMAAVVAVYLAPLVAVAALLHLNRFELTAPISWGFFIASAGLGAAALLAVRRRKSEHLSSNVETTLMAMMLLGGLGLGIWGAAMFIHPATPLRSVFPWPRDPLTSRLIAVMLLSMAAALIMGRRRRLQAEVSLVFTACYGFSVCAAWIVASVEGNPFPALYASAFSVLGVSSALLLWRVRQEPLSLAFRQDRSS